VADRGGNGFTEKQKKIEEEAPWTLNMVRRQRPVDNWVVLQTDSLNSYKYAAAGGGKH